MFILNVSITPVVLTANLLRRLIAKHLPHDPNKPREIAKGSRVICFTETANYQVQVARAKDPSQEEPGEPFLQVKLQNGILRSVEFVYPTFNFPERATFTFNDVANFKRNEWGEIATLDDLESDRELPPEIPDAALKHLKHFPCAHYYRSVIEILQETAQKKLRGKK